VAAQQILTSYLWPSFSLWIKYQEDMPFGEELDGKAAEMCVLKLECCGDMESSWRSCKVGCSSGICVYLGATNIVFSVLASTLLTAASSNAN
jgi:hypothetical protein